jgi:hypothetical protein
MNLDQATELPCLAGRWPGIAAVFARLPKRRLVILGQGGAGKSVLAQRLCRELAAQRNPGEPVPVILEAAGWSPWLQPQFPVWLAQRLASDYSSLAGPAGTGRTIAAELLERDLILPILDGLDELGAQFPLAITMLSGTLPATWGLVLTSRPEAYARAVTIRPLAAAAVVEVQPLGLSELAAYLPRTVAITRTGGVTSDKWQPVLRHLRDGSADSTRDLLELLSTPLMAALARAAYSDTEADPQKLMTSAAESIAHAERELLAGWIPMAYNPKTSPVFDSDDAQRYLSYFAEQLQRNSVYDILWWRLPAVPGWVNHIAAPVVLGLINGCILIAVPVLGSGINYGVATARETLMNLGSFAMVYGMALSVVLWHVGGLTRATQDVARSQGLRMKAVLVAMRSGPCPETVRYRIFRRSRRIGMCITLNTIAVGFMAVAEAIAITVIVASLRGVMPVWSELRAGLGTWFLLGAAVGFIYALGRVIATPLPQQSGSLSPGELLATDRVATMIRAAIPAMAFTALMLLAAPVTSLVDLASLITNGSLVGISYAFGGSAWARLSVARVWLGLSGRLPLRLMTFLDDACRRGVLRQHAGEYRFRHNSLQQHLANDR